MNTIRAFIALETPEAIKQFASNVQGELKQRYNCRIAWTKAQGIHLTLKFLGNIPEDLVDDIGYALEQELSTMKSFELALDRPGVFGGRNPRVLWIGFKPSMELDILNKLVEASVSKFGFAPEKRKFHPHLTLGRVRDPAGTRELVEYFKRMRISSMRFQAEKIVFYRSELKPSGAEYYRLKTINLL